MRSAGGQGDRVGPQLLSERESVLVFISSPLLQCVSTAPCRFPHTVFKHSFGLCGMQLEDDEVCFRKDKPDVAFQMARGGRRDSSLPDFPG